MQLDSFIHLHLGIDSTNLPEDLECHHLIINDLYKNLPAPHNVCIVSIPTGEPCCIGAKRGLENPCFLTAASAAACPDEVLSACSRLQLHADYV